MLKRTEGYFTGENGTQLFYQSWKHENPVGTLIVTHGLCEHSEYYHRLAEGIAESKWNVVAWDLRGHGRSEGKRGLVLDFMDYCRDHLTFCRLMHEKYPDLPTVQLGHSMGGLIVTRSLLSFSELQPKAVVLSAPAFGVAMPVPKIKDIASRVLRKLWPTLTLASEVEYASLSKIPEMLREFEHDTLRHSRVSAGVYLGILENSQYCLENAASFHHRLLMQLPAQDPICSTPASEEFFEKVGASAKQVHLYHNSLHEIYNDVEQDQAFSDLVEFLRQSDI